jgi:hypothetical protein
MSDYWVLPKPIAAELDRLEDELAEAQAQRNSFQDRFNGAMVMLDEKDAEINRLRIELAEMRAGNRGRLEIIDEQQVELARVREQRDKVAKLLRELVDERRCPVPGTKNIYCLECNRNVTEYAHASWCRVPERMAILDAIEEDR